MPSGVDLGRFTATDVRHGRRFTGLWGEGGIWSEEVSEGEAKNKSMMLENEGGFERRRVLRGEKKGREWRERGRRGRRNERRSSSSSG